VSLQSNPAVRLPIEVAAVAFDLDGTLVDTLPDLYEAGSRTLRDLGRTPVDIEQVRAYVGDGVDRLVKRLLTGTAQGEPEAKLFGSARERFLEHYQALFMRLSNPYPGVADALQRMRAQGLQLACVTNKPERFTVPLLESVGLLRCLDVVVSGDTLPRKKPDPLPLLHVAAQFAIAPRLLLMIGDSNNDCAAARAAGCPVFCVPYGYRAGMEVRALDCDAIVPAVPDSLALIRSVRS
jgi:phosphoglycolate phosphatase